MENHYHLSASRKMAKVAMNIFACKPRKLQERKAKSVFDVEILERHPFTPQTFVPLGLSREDKDGCYLIIVAPTLPTRSWDKKDGRTPPYPTPVLRRKRGLKERLLGARPNPFTNDFLPTTTKSSSIEAAGLKPKGPGPPDLANLKAFIARGDQAFTYGPGTWHAPMVVLGEKAIEFVVVQYVNGVGIEDCQETEIQVDDGGEGLAVDVSSGANRVGMSPKAKL